jgi:hypothetical protein
VQQEEPTDNFPHDSVSIISFGKESYQYALLHTSPILHEQTLHDNFYLDISETISSKQITLRYVCLSICLSIYLPTYLSMVLQPFVGPWPLFQFLNSYTVGRAPWMGDEPVARPLHAHSTAQRINTHRHPCLKWYSNPRSQCLSERRQFMLLTVRSL